MAVAILCLGLPFSTTTQAASDLDCVECGFGKDDGEKASQLTLDYGGAPGIVTVYRGNKVKDDNLLFEGFLNPGDRFTIDAATLDEDDLGSKVGFYLDGTFIAEIHTSCSAPLGPGTTEANQEKGKDPNGEVDFTVVSGKDKKGRDLCDIPPPPPPGADCVECGFGADDANKVSELTLVYSGEAGIVRVYNGNKTDDDELIFVGFLSPGQEFTIEAAAIGEDKFGSKVGFYLNGTDKQDKIAEIHTSCSAPLGPGTTEANQEKGKDPNGEVDFTVVSGKDKKGRDLCDIPPPPPPGADCVECGEGADDADRLSQLTMRYLGPETVVTVYDHKLDGGILFQGTLRPGQVFTVYASTLGEDRLGSKILLYAGEVQLAEIHTSCSSPVTTGLTEQTQPKAKDPNGTEDFAIVSAVDSKGRVICGSDECIANNPPSVEFTAVNNGGLFIDVLVTDDVALTSVDYTIGGDAGSLGFVSRTDVSPQEVKLRFSIDNPRLNGTLSIDATDDCDAKACEDASPPLITAQKGIELLLDGNGDPIEDPNKLGFQWQIDGRGLVTDDQGVLTLQFFVLNNARILLLDESGFEPTILDQVQSAVGVIDPAYLGASVPYVFQGLASGNRQFGAMAADQCNAYVFDPEGEAGEPPPIGSRLAGGSFSPEPPPFVAATAADALPTEYALEGNFPNPFKRTTTLTFALPEQADVRLALYDVLGREVRVLAEGVHPAGTHKAVIEASALSAGVYLYRLATPQRTFVKSMTVIR